MKELSHERAIGKHGHHHETDKLNSSIKKAVVQLLTLKSLKLEVPTAQQLSVTYLQPSCSTCLCCKSNTVAGSGGVQRHQYDP